MMSFEKVPGVGEYSIRTEGKGVTHAGAMGSENVGTSNRNGGGIPPRRKNKVSFAMEIIEGLVGPKPMARAAGDWTPRLIFRDFCIERWRDGVL